LMVLGRAYWLTGNRAYRDAAIAHLRGWIEANPPLVGINWASMLELGFRSISWIWAINFFADPDAEGETWLVDVMLALDRQLRHIEDNLSHYFSPNTHLLGEALALYVAGRSLPILASAERYANTGRRILVEQTTRQIGRDGGHLERSTHYHRYTLDFYLLAAIVSRITSDSATPVLEACAGRLASAARLLADSEGRLPHIGDDDGGMLMPMCGREPEDIRDSLAAAATLLGRSDLQIGATPEEACWLFAHPSIAPLLEHAEPGRNFAPVSAALPDTGYYVSRSAGHHLVLDAGEHGYENGGHAHADALSMTLSVRGTPLLIDPGTAAYTIDRRARDAFRSSMLHNTITIDGRSQSEPAGPFHWTRTARARAHVWRTSERFDYLEASHDGYAPIVHRRHVLAAHDDLLVVADLVAGEGRHEIAGHWHLSPEWTVDRERNRMVLRTESDRVECAVSRGAVEQLRGSSSQMVGWHSPVYGRLERTSTLRVFAADDLPIWMVTVFNLAPDNELLAVEPVQVRAPAQLLARCYGVRISRAQSVDLFGVMTAGPSRDSGEARRPIWQIGSYETDARMLLCRVGSGGSPVAVV
ncbi:MAG TPA: alginate lyase family protein, partial [Gemmatimonadaceae bacterium]